MTDGDPLFARFGRTCAPGDVLFREGDPGDHLFVIQAGEVRITKTVREREKLLAVLGPGEFFGEMAILNAKPRTANAEVVTDARLLVLSAKTFEQMVKGNAEIAVRLIKKLASRLDAADELIEVLMQRDPRARIILGLARGAELQGETHDDGSIFVPVERTDLQAQVSVSDEEAADVLARLRRLTIAEETVDADGRPGFLIHDLVKLREFLAFLEKRDRVGEG